MIARVRAKPCPFCRTDNKLRMDECDVFWVVCDYCLATGPAAKTHEDAIEIWNWSCEPRPKRPKSKPIVERLEQQ